jgi:hypothetical protein
MHAGAMLLGLVLGGCALIPKTEAPPPSAMNAVYTDFRRDLDVDAQAVARPPYQAVPSCTYRAFGTELGAGGDRPIELSVLTVRERLLVSIAAGSDKSTALIDGDGQMFDFSLADQGSIANPETWTSIARQRAESFRRAGRGDAHVFNSLSLIVPHYLPARFEPGATVAVLADEDGKIWARHVYRGVTPYAGRQALLFDLLGAATAPEAGAKADRLVGFALVDSATMLPLALVLDTGQKLRFEQLGCR